MVVDFEKDGENDFVGRGGYGRVKTGKKNQVIYISHTCKHIHTNTPSAAKMLKQSSLRCTKIEKRK